MITQTRPKTYKKQKALKCGRFTLRLWERTHVMGILNRTPDSFFDGGMYENIERASKHVFEMVEEGADIIDIGGESTRPGSSPIDCREELRRTIPIIKEVSSAISVPIS